jgi:hypothetical protein
MLIGKVIGEIVASEKHPSHEGLKLLAVAGLEYLGSRTNAPGMWQSADSLSLTDEQKNQLEKWVQAPSTPQKVVLRARICLLAHEGLANRRIAQQLKTSRPTVLLWRNHFLKSGVAGLEHEPARQTSGQRTKDHQIKESKAQEP